jgi:hypothetical protein
MRGMRVLTLAILPALLLTSCATAQAMRSPLRERLEKSDTPAIEDATRSCLTDQGWKVDPIGSVSGGSNVVSAKLKDHEPTQVFINAPDQKPRVTGGPDDEKFWKCLAAKLGGEGGDDTGDAGKDDKAKGDKGDKDKDNGDKGSKDDKGS